MEQAAVYFESATARMLGLTALMIVVSAIRRDWRTFVMSFFPLFTILEAGWLGVLICFLTTTSLVMWLTDKRLQTVELDPFWGVPDETELEPGNFFRSPSDSFQRLFPESLVAGSHLQPRPTGDKPACSSSVEVNGKKISDCQRIGDSLIVPYHTISQARLDFFEVPKRNGGYAKVSVHIDNVPNFRVHLHDIAVFQPGSAFWADTGMKAAKIGMLTDGSIVTAQSVAKSSSSYGKVVRDGKAPYMLCYYGSTQPGFSGCGYFIGNSLVGIHLGGGSATLNYGVCADLIKKLVAPKPESAGGIMTDPDYLRKLNKNGRIKEFNLIDEETVVFFDGRNWRTIGYDVWEEAFEGYAEWEESLEKLADAQEEFIENKRLGRRGRNDRDGGWEGYEPEGDFDALDVSAPVFRDPPNLDTPPLATPMIRAQPMELVQGPGTTSQTRTFTPGPLRTAEMPRVSTQSAEERVEVRDRALKRVVSLKAQRSELQAAVDNNSMTLARCGNQELREKIIAEQNTIQSRLTSLNLALTEANLAAEKAKALTPEENAARNRKKKRKVQRTPQQEEEMKIQAEIADCRRRLAALRPLPQRPEMTPMNADAQAFSSMTGQAAPSMRE